MPRFFFHLYNTAGAARDEEGYPLPGLEAAESFAIASIRSILKDEVDAGRLDLRGRIEIADDGGRVLATVPFGAAVELKLDQQGRAG